MEFSFELHKGQTRKVNGSPYFGHLLAVSSLVFDFHGNEEQAIAALLHDGPEDCGGLRILRRIEHRFGKHVAHIVEEMSDNLGDVTRGGQEKLPWKMRKDAWLARLPAMHADTYLVAACDKLHNMRSLQRSVAEAVDQEGRDAVWARFKGGKDGTMWYFGEIMNFFRSVDVLPQPAMRELEEVLESVRASA